MAVGSKSKKVGSETRKCAVRQVQTEKEPIPWLSRFLKSMHRRGCQDAGDALFIFCAYFALLFKTASGSADNANKTMNNDVNGKHVLCSTLCQGLLV